MQCMCLRTCDALSSQMLQGCLRGQFTGMHCQNARSIALPLPIAALASPARPGTVSGSRCRRHMAARQWPRRSKGVRAVTVCKGIKAVESYSGEFALAAESEQLLKTLLRSPAFCAQVVQQCSLPEGTRVEFADVLFQPVPWSPATKKGMPAEFERYHNNPDYTIINIPPNFMFQAKIFKPSRLCAVYQLAKH